MPTPLNVCPFTLSVHPPQSTVLDAEGKKPQNETLGAVCVGPRCHLWRFEMGQNPLDGDCGFNHLLNAIMLIATRTEQAFSAGMAEGHPPAQG